MIEFVESKEIYASEETLRAKIELLQKTRMVDLAGDFYKQLNKESDIPDDMKNTRAEVIQSLQSLSKKAEKILEFLKDADNKQKLRATLENKKQMLQTISKENEIDEEQIEALFRYAKFQFDCGKYEISADLLDQFLLVSTDQAQTRSAMWGKLASNCLLQKWDQANEDLTKLKDMIEQTTFKTFLEQMRNRCWVCHWSLFVFFNQSEQGAVNLCDMFFQDKYMQAIQYEAPYLLRYLAAAVIMVKRRRASSVRDICRIMQVEQYRDPVLEFFDQLFVKFDFDGAQVALENCDSMLKNDFFLAKHINAFNENARMHIFETYCRVQKTIQIEELAKKLNLTLEDAERWIVNLIRTSKLRAKIDMEAGIVTMLTDTHSTHEQIFDKTKQMLAKTYQLAHTVLSHTPRD